MLLGMIQDLYRFSVEYEAVQRLFDCGAPGRPVYCSPGLEVCGLESSRASYLRLHTKVAVLIEARLALSRGSIATFAKQFT